MVNGELYWSEMVGILGDIGGTTESELELGEIWLVVGICIGKEEVVGWSKGGLTGFVESVRGGCLRLDGLGSGVCVMCG